MVAFFAFVAGYVVGTRAGPQGLEELRDAWQTIRESEEVKELVSGGLAMLGDLLARGSSVLSEQMDGQLSRKALSPVA